MKRGKKLACVLTLLGLLLVRCQSATEPAPLLDEPVGQAIQEQPPQEEEPVSQEVEEPLPEPTDIPPTPTASSAAEGDFRGYVDVGGHRLFLDCQGQGTPTVLLEAGMTMGMKPWEYAQRELAKSSKVCSYDRAYLGKSDPSSVKSRTIQHMVDDLHALLEAAQVPGPYLMVGHSLGGWIVQLYAVQHPDQVIGLVLVDPAQAKANERHLAALPEPSEDEFTKIDQLRLDLVMDNQDEALNVEPFDLEASITIMRQLETLGDVKLTLLGHDPVRVANDEKNRYDAMTPYDEEVPLEIFEAVEDAWLDMLTENVALSTQGELVIVEKATHLSFLNLQRASVIQAVEEMLARLRS